MWITNGWGTPPLAWGYTPPSPRIPPYYMSKCRFGGDNTLSNDGLYLYDIVNEQLQKQGK